ncbi:hypothetical protein ACFTWS_29200 [Streptomyces sp. NPDC057027]|uniref:hypothetical protein n=1 Tax=Streptomyces sp. NPDC057027 TaxID=3346004 RepID=UPI00363DD2FD
MRSCVPAPNGLGVAASAVVTDEQGHPLRFAAPRELASLPVHHAQRLRIRRFLEHRSAPYLG